MKYLLGIDLGGSSIKALALSETGEILLQHRRDFDLDIAEDWMKQAQNLVREIEEFQKGRAWSIGVCAPGLANDDGQSIRVMPKRLKGLEGLNWAEFLNRQHPVPVMNDAQAALLGEDWKGAAQAIDNVLFMSLGTGVGGAAKVDGRLLKGAFGRAGHVGHICLDTKGEADICKTPGSLELAVGNASTSKRTHNAFKSTGELVKAACLGDANAKRIWLETVRNLACGIASLINVLDPEIVLIGGGIAEAGNALFDPLRVFLDEMEWIISEDRVEIRQAKLGQWAGAFGAAISGKKAIVK